MDCGSVVLACGAQNVHSQRWGVSGDPIAAPSISAYIDGADQEIPLFEFSAECGPGYRWLFPMGEGRANVGVFVPARASGAVMKALGRSFVERRQGAARASWRGGVGALWSGRGKVWPNNAGLVSCGDAAGLIRPADGGGDHCGLAQRCGRWKCDRRLSTREPRLPAARNLLELDGPHLFAPLCTVAPA